ncbi:uncharacterized protein LOC113202831 [Frankliniella occidentalis]|uniref:Uncharacterized protein LOC113202831 n=1 Tax=Frankliniella occidentalis TaxID=133901 RepID=A0A6J1RVP7_FRAOC|nr:uncharacterized protein LOC113202831 [Frankliniella occidentalis]
MLPPPPSEVRNTSLSPSRLVYYCTDMDTKRVTSTVDVTVAIPFPRRPAVPGGVKISASSFPLVSSDALWTWTIKLEVTEGKPNSYRLKVLCSASDRNKIVTGRSRPSAETIIPWGGYIEYWYPKNTKRFTLSTVGRALDMPYEVFTQEYPYNTYDGYPVEATFKIDLRLTSMQKVKPQPEPAFSGVCLLTKSLDSLLESGLMSDVKLCTDGQEIPAHCCILAARSEFFKVKFKPEWDGIGNALVDVSDVSVPTLKEMLRYIYTGSLGKNVDMTKLLIAADQYLVTDLCNEVKERLKYSLESNSSTAPSVCCNLLKTSATNNSPSLRRVVLQYLQAHREQIMKSKEWEEFQIGNRQVAAEAVLDMYNLRD